MYDFQDKPKDKRPAPSGPKPAPQQRPRQSGDRVKLSAFGDKYACASLQDVDRVMPEKMRLKEEQPGARMNSVKPGTYSGAEESPDKLMELETDTGKAEIGYDRKSMDTVVSFTQDEQSSKGRQVVENKSLVKRAMNGDKFRSNDRSFENGAMSLRVDANSSPRFIRRQLYKGSDKEDPTTMDRVIPFHSRKKTEKRKRQNLLQMLHGQHSASPKPGAEQEAQKYSSQGISKAITALSTMEGQKARMGMEFRQKFDKAVKKSRSLHRENDMYVILRRKKRLIMEAIALGGLAELAGSAEDINVPDLENADNKEAKDTESEVWAGSKTNGATEHR